MPQNRTYHSGRSRQSSFSSRSRSGRSSPKNRGPKKEYIHQSKLVRAARPRAEVVYEPTHRFADFAVEPLIHTNLETMGLQIPSPIQDQTIPYSLQGKDIVGIANTGTGKTAAFAIPVLQRLITQPSAKAVILAPTRELAEQIEVQCRAIGKDSGLDGALLIGGASMGAQLRSLRYKPRIIIGTPGRIKDHLERGSLDISDCDMTVLDEVDRMLDMGFINDIIYILSHVKPERQSFYFSATLDSRVKSIIDTFSEDAVHVSVKSGDTSDNVDQDVVTLEYGESKVDKLHDILIKNGNNTKAIIFDDTQRSVEKLANELASRGFNADSIHGGKSQPQRQRVLRKFKENEVTVLVATDVAARGIDISDITHVINYSMPQSYNDYVHRIGRTGRAGRTGHALTFIDS